MTESRRAAKVAVLKRWEEKNTERAAKKKGMKKIKRREAEFQDMFNYYMREGRHDIVRFMMVEHQFRWLYKNI